MRRPLTAPALLLLLLVPAAVSADVGCVGLCGSEVLFAPTTTVSVYALPDGAGWPFAAARAEGGHAPVDASIRAVFVDCCERPLANLPAEDLWLETTAGGLVACAGGSVSDAGTDALGRVAWTSPLRAGGHSCRSCGERTRVVAAGMDWPVTIDLLFNSPDINGDLRVNLSDTVLFVADLLGGYDYRSDFWFDGVLDLSDVVLFSQGLGSDCP